MNFDLNEIQANVMDWEMDVTWSHPSDVIGWDRGGVLFNSLISDKLFVSWRQRVNVWYPSTIVYIVAHASWHP